MHKLIRASAGTGKTYQLSGHFLRQLFAGHAPETILATTFTRKAAGEILGRVLLRLAEAADDDTACTDLAEFLSPVEVTRERARELLVEVTAQLHRMRVSTLDSFFQQVARSLTLELGLPPGWSIIDEHVERQIRDQAIDGVLAQQVPRDAQRLMQMLAKGRSKRSVRDLIDDTIKDYHELYRRADSDAWHRIPRLPQLTKIQIEDAQTDAAVAAVGEDARTVKAVTEHLDNFRKEKWEAFLKKGIASKVLYGESHYNRKPIPPGLVAAFEPLVLHAKSMLLESLAQQTKAIWQLMDRFDREYSRIRAEHGWMSFSDVTRVLAKSQDAATTDRMSFRLDTRLGHLLLDEFQDTSPQQWKILKRLTEHVTSSDDGSFFCVGDPKQAIYGWRGGAAEILDVAEDAVPGIVAESLDQSRRSSVAVVETVNRVFQHLSEHTDLRDHEKACVQWQQAFPEHSTVHDDRGGYAEMKSSPDFRELPAAELRPAFFSWAAREIRDLHQKCPQAEIGVLTEKNDTVARLVHQLTLLGVPASEEGGTPPTDSPAVLTVLSLLRLASHPGCEVSRFHVSNSLLSSVVGLTDWNDHQAAARVSADLRARLMDDGYGRTLQWLFNQISQHCSGRDQLRLKQIVAEGWKFDREPSLDPGEFITALENSRISKSQTAPVRVMTVHQSKGLEFDIVVLPELDRGLFRPPAAAIGLPSPTEAPDHICVWRNKLVRKLLPQELQAAFDDTARRNVSERLCLLYVALTRAAHAIHLLIPTGSRNNSGVSSSGLLLAALKGDREVEPDEILYQTGHEDWYQQSGGLSSAAVHHRPTIPQPVSVALAPMAERTRGLRRESPSDHDSVGIRRPSRASSGNVPAIDPRLRGSIIHAWFECVEWLEIQGPPDTELFYGIAEEYHTPRQVTEQLLGEFSRWMEQNSTRDCLSRAATQERWASRLAADGFGDEQVEWEVCNERSFVVLRNGAVVQGTIDRLVLARHNNQPVAAEIIDFKTDRLNDVDVDEWCQTRADQYRSQLSVYRDAVHECFGVPMDNISAHLLLLEADRVADISLESPHLTPSAADAL